MRFPLVQRALKAVGFGVYGVYRASESLGFAVFGVFDMTVWVLLALGPFLRVQRLLGYPLNPKHQMLIS